jgi:GT2 family glycosyltransferase
MQDRQTTFISECACAFRRSVFDTVTPYWDAFFINMEGADLALRILDAGFEIWYVPTIEVYHSMSDETRDKGRDFYHNPRNLILLAYRNISWSKLFTFLAPRLVGIACCSVIRGYFARFMKGILDGIIYITRANEARRPVRRQTMDRFDEIRCQAPALVSRLSRYWRFVGNAPK